MNRAQSMLVPFMIISSLGDAYDGRQYGHRVIYTDGNKSVFFSDRRGAEWLLSMEPDPKSCSIEFVAPPGFESLTELYEKSHEDLH